MPAFPHRGGRKSRGLPASTPPRPSGGVKRRPWMCPPPPGGGGQEAAKLAPTRGQACGRRASAGRGGLQGCLHLPRSSTTLELLFVNPSVTPKFSLMKVVHRAAGERDEPVQQGQARPPTRGGQAAAARHARPP
jgi:hypothetical protein